uniref:Armadillo repeat-containing domain-containing protein n=1 Tax=Salvator merianae TaxID=96440 RepID=A0A8D0E6V7_SALMN
MTIATGTGLMAKLEREQKLLKIWVPVENYPIPASRANAAGELRWLLQSLASNVDDDTKRTTLHRITQCIYLRESEANACTNDDIKLVASFMDDGDMVVKTEALNALKAFTIVWKFKIKIQEYVSKIVELVTSIWDTNLQVAGLKLLNGLNIPDHTHSLLRRMLPNFMEILLTANNLVKVQVLKFLSTLAQKEDLLYDIMNCQASSEFLNLFQSSLPGNLLYEILVFVERLSEGRLTPQYQSMQWQYSANSLHELIFGDNSRLSDRLLALIVHPEEEVQAQACKVILSLRLNREESQVGAAAPLAANISAYPLESTRISQANHASLSNQPFSPSEATSANASFDTSRNDTSHSFHPLQGSVDSFYPLQTGDHSFHPSEDHSSHIFQEPSDSFHPPAADYTEDSCA